MGIYSFGRALVVAATLSAVATTGATRLNGETPQVPQLLTSAPAADSAASQHASERGVVRARTAGADLSTLAGDSELLDVAFFDDARYLVQRERVEHLAAGRFVWQGRVAGTDYAVSFAVTDGVLVG